MFTDNALLEAFVGSVPREYGIHAKLAPVPGKNLRQIIIEQPKGYEVLNYAENQYSAKDQVADMQTAKIDKAILRLPCWQEWLGPRDVPARSTTAWPSTSKRYPGRFQALAVVAAMGIDAIASRRWSAASRISGSAACRWPRITASSISTTRRSSRISSCSIGSASRSSSTTRRCRSTTARSSPTPTCDGSTAVASPRARRSGASCSAGCSRNSRT